MKKTRLVAGLALVAGLLTAMASPAGAVATGSRERTALVLPVSWTAGNGSPAASPDRSALDIRDAVGKTATNWFRLVSHGQFPGWSAKWTGVRISAPQMDASGRCDGGFQRDLASKANAAAREVGFDPAAFDTVVYYFAKVANCPWAGLSDGKVVWLNGTISVGTVVQELGHTLQLGHGLAYKCRDQKYRYLSLGGFCEVVAYGDQYNAMGSGVGSFSAIQQWDLGWMERRLVQVGLTGGAFTVAPLEIGDQLTQALRIPDGDGWLWVEYRRKLGVDTPYATQQLGVLVRREIPAQGRKSFLLDMTPDGNFWDSHLPVGATFTSPNSGWTLRVTSEGERGARVVVTVPKRPVPDVVGMSKDTAAITLQNAGFRSKVIYQLDSTCATLNEVISQTPAGGTSVAQGSTVTIYVGKAPSGGCS